MQNNGRYAQIPEPEAELIVRLQSGDMAAFRDVYDRFKRFVYNLAYRFHGNAADAEDSLQETFLNVFRHARSFTGKAKFTTWLYRIAVNACISQRRGKSRNQEYTEESPPDLPPHPDSAPGDHALAELLERELQRLSSIERAVFLLHASDGFTHAQVGEMLGFPEGTSKSHYHRARTKLAARFQSLGITMHELTQ